MPDFRSRGEQNHDRKLKRTEERDYKQAFEQAATQVSDLQARIDELENQQSNVQDQLQTMATTHAENIRSMRQQIESGMAKLIEDNERLHALIRAGQESDLKLVEQMDKNHKERMSSILQLVDKQKALPDG